MAPMVKRCGFPMFSHKFRDGQRTKMGGQKSGSPWHGTTCPSSWRKIMQSCVFFLGGSTMNVGGWSVVWNILNIFYSIWDVILPIDYLHSSPVFCWVSIPPTRFVWYISHWRTHIFQDGYCTTKQVVLVVSRFLPHRQDDFRAAAHEEGRRA